MAIVQSLSDDEITSPRTLDDQLVNDLVSALNEAAMLEPSLQNLGLTREWLEEAVRSDPVKSRWKDWLAYTRSDSTRDVVLISNFR